MGRRCGSLLLMVTRRLLLHQLLRSLTLVELEAVHKFTIGSFRQVIVLKLLLLAFGSMIKLVRTICLTKHIDSVSLATRAGPNQLRVMCTGGLLLMRMVRAWVNHLRLLNYLFKSIAYPALTLIELHTGCLFIRLTFQLLL